MMTMLLALDDEWLAYAGRVAAVPRVEPTLDGDDRGNQLSRVARYSSLEQPCTVAWHPEHISLGVAAFEGDPRHASTLLERKLRAQGEISSDVKILILESLQVGRGYQVFYVTVALDEWQHMLSWAGSQQNICGLTLAAALAFKRVQANRAVVLHVGRHFHFFARHDGQLIHLQAVSLDENLADLAAVAAMLGGQAKAEMAARGCSQFNVVWVPGAFMGPRSDLDTLSSAFGHAAHAAIEVDSEVLGTLDDVGAEVHSGLLELARHARPRDLLNQGEDKLQVLAREYLPYAAVAAVVAAIGLGYVGYGWVSEASSLRQRAQQLQADEATVRQSIAVIARDTALERPAVNRQVEILQMLNKVQGDHDPAHLLNALKDGAQGGMRILSISSIRPTAASADGTKPAEAPAMVVDGTLPENAINSDQDTRSLSRLVKTLEDHGYRAEPVDIRSAAAGQDLSTRLFSYRVTRAQPPGQRGS